MTEHDAAGNGDSVAPTPTLTFDLFEESYFDSELGQDGGFRESCAATFAECAQAGIRRVRVKMIVESIDDEEPAQPTEKGESDALIDLVPYEDENRRIVGFEFDVCEVSLEEFSDGYVAPRVP